MCVFCEIVKGNIPSYKLYEDEDVLAILDIAQVTKGHTLVLPKKHFDSLLDADTEVLQKMIPVIQNLAKQIREKTGCAGINVLNNNGEAAGQSVSHLHFHIIPRYDENDAIVAEFKESGIDVKESAKLLGIL